jgi:Ca2+-binding RTX toxin-like protein
MFADQILQADLERIMGGGLPPGVYGGTRLIKGPITGGTGSGGTDSGGTGLGGGTSTPVASSTLYRQMLKDVDGDGDLEEVWVPALEYTSSKDPVTGSTTISIRWADGIREQNVITRDNRETNITWFPEGIRTEETSVPGGPSTYREYNADGSLRNDVHTDSEGNETSTYYGDGYVTESATDGEWDRSVRTNSDGSRIEAQENSETKYTSFQEYSANGQLLRSQTRWGDNSEEIYMLMPNGKGITYRSGPRFGDSVGESLTLEGADRSERQMLNDVTNELQDYTGEGRGNAQNGAVEIDDGAQKYRVETTLGTAANDTISGHGMLVGGKGADRLTGREHADILLGGNGDDALQGGAGSDVLDGGAGFDFASYTTAVTANLSDDSQNTGEAAGDTYSGIEGIYGSNYADKLTGNASGNIIYGGWGEDTVSGLAGNDHLLAGDSNDVLEGGAGADTLDGGNGYDYVAYITGVTVNLSNAAQNTGEAAGDVHVSIEGIYGSNHRDVLIGNAADNTFYGGWGEDELSGLAGNDRLLAGDSNDMLEGGTGADTMDGGNGLDFATYFKAAAGVTANLSNAGANAGEAYGDVYGAIEGLQGSAYADVLTGNGGYNELFGHNGNDQLYGLADGDYLSGGEGHDILVGGAGSDWLTGGNGSDQFRFDTALGAGNVDIVNDFTKGQDLLVLSRSVFTAFGPGTPGATTILAYAAAYAFTTGAGATSTSHKIVYNSATGDLFYDADGTGAMAQVKFAMVGKGLALSANDFMLI